MKHLIPKLSSLLKSISIFLQQLMNHLDLFLSEELTNLSHNLNSSQANYDNLNSWVSKEALYRDPCLRSKKSNINDQFIKESNLSKHHVNPTITSNTYKDLFLNKETTNYKYEPSSNIQNLHNIYKRARYTATSTEKLSTTLTEPIISGNSLDLFSNPTQFRFQGQYDRLMDPLLAYNEVPPSPITSEGISNCPDSVLSDLESVDEGTPPRKEFPIPWRRKSELRRESEIESKIESRRESKVESRRESEIESKIESEINSLNENENKIKLEIKNEYKDEHKNEYKNIFKFGPRFEPRFESRFEPKIQPRFESKPEIKSEVKKLLEEKPKKIASICDVREALGNIKLDKGKSKIDDTIIDNANEPINKFNFDNFPKDVIRDANNNTNKDTSRSIPEDVMDNLGLLFSFDIPDHDELYVSKSASSSASSSSPPDPLPSSSTSIPIATSAKFKQFSREDFGSACNDKYSRLNNCYNKWANIVKIPHPIAGVGVEKEKRLAGNKKFIDIPTTLYHSSYCGHGPIRPCVYFTGYDYGFFSETKVGPAGLRLLSKEEREQKRELRKRKAMEIMGGLLM